MSMGKSTRLRKFFDYRREIWWVTIVRKGIRIAYIFTTSLVNRPTSGSSINKAMRVLMLTVPNMDPDPHEPGQEPIGLTRSPGRPFTMSWCRASESAQKPALSQRSQQTARHQEGRAEESRDWRSHKGGIKNGLLGISSDFIYDPIKIMMAGSATETASERSNSFLVLGMLLIGSMWRKGEGRYNPSIVLARMDA